MVVQLQNKITIESLAYNHFLAQQPPSLTPIVTKKVKACPEPQSMIQAELRKGDSFHWVSDAHWVSLKAPPLHLVAHQAVAVSDFVGLPFAP